MVGFEAGGVRPMLSALVPGPLPCGARTSVSGVRQSSRRSVNRLFLLCWGNLCTGRWTEVHVRERTAGKVGGERYLRGYSVVTLLWR
jgi:hypothetical protein